jgi:hypothetical protein
MGIFNSKSDNDAFSPQDLKELFQRLEHLERKCRRLDARIAELEDEFASQRNRAASAKMDEATATPPVDQSADKPADSRADQPIDPHVTVSFGMMEDDEPVGINCDPTPSAEPAVGGTVVNVRTATVYYLPAPTPDGLFLQASEREQIGKSVYQLTTSDGQNGTFILLDTPDAIEEVPATDSLSPSSSAAIYNLKGQRLNTPQRGVNIVGGTKIIVK